MRTFVAPRAERALMSVGLVVAALVITLLQPVGAASAATTPVPTPPALPAEIEPLPAYQGAQLCDPVAHSGPKALKALLTATYGTTSYGITRSCSGSTSTSEHMEGRALDWMITGTAQKADANAFLAWLFADDAAGNHYAMARRMGIMYIVWNNKMFRLYDTARGWAEYDGCLSLTSSSYDTTCHRNHVHFSFTWDGAAAKTSYWSGTAITAPNCPSAASVGAPPALPTTGLEFVPLPPARLLDTAAAVGVTARCRLSQDAYSGDNRRIDLQVSGRGGVPSTGATAVTLSIQLRAPNAPTKLFVEPAGQTTARLRASTTGMTVDGLGEVTVPLGYAGKVSFTLTTGASDVTIDVLGYYRPADGTGQLFHPTTPVRLVNTVSAHAPLAPGESRTIDVAGLAGVPAAGATAVTVALSIYDPPAAGGATLYGADDPAPPAGQLSVSSPANGRRTNLVVARLSASGQLVLRNDGTGSRDVAVDVLGWWAPGSVAGGSLYKVLKTAEVIDTTQSQGVVGAMTAGRTATVTLAGVGGVPSATTATVTAVALQATVIGPDANTALVAWQGGATKPAIRDASPRTGPDHTVLVVAPLAAGKASFQNTTGSVDLRAYAVGYWYQP